MKRKLIIIIVAAAVCVIAFCVLFLTGVIKFDKAEVKQDKSQAVAYVHYLDAHMLVGRDYQVYGSEVEAPSQLPEIAGVFFDNVVVGKKLALSNEPLAAYAMRIVESLRKNSISVDQVFVSESLDATLFVGNVKILLGKEANTEEKIHDLRDFFDEVKDLSGTLNMQELSKNNLGYSFKTN